MARLPMGFRPWALSLTCTARIAAVAFVLGSCLTAHAQQPPKPSPSPSGVGRTPSKAELDAWDIAISPDGAELPAGSGNATQGALVFTQRGCSDCHGPTAKEGPALELVGGKILPGT